MLQGAAAPCQRLFEQVEEGGMPFVAAGARRFGAQRQLMTFQQLMLEIGSRRRRQLGPGLRRQDHQASQVVGGTLGQRQHQKAGQRNGGDELDQQESHGEQQRILPRQAGRRAQASPPRGLNR